MCLFRWDQKLFAMQPSDICKKTKVVCYLFTFLLKLLLRMLTKE